MMHEDARNYLCDVASTCERLNLQRVHDLHEHFDHLAHETHAAAGKNSEDWEERGNNQFGDGGPRWCFQQSSVRDANGGRVAAREKTNKKRTNNDGENTNINNRAVVYTELIVHSQVCSCLEPGLVAGGAWTIGEGRQEGCCISRREVAELSAVGRARTCRRGDRVHPRHRRRRQPPIRLRPPLGRGRGVDGHGPQPHGVRLRAAVQLGRRRLRADERLLARGDGARAEGALRGPPWGAPGRDALYLVGGQRE